MAKPIKLNGGSGASYLFDAHPWGAALPNRGGVYAVLKMEGDVILRVIYVGQTKNLSDRLVGHDEGPCFARHGRTHVATHLSEDEAVRLGMERSLIGFHSPPCNG